MEETSEFEKEYWVLKAKMADLRQSIEALEARMDLEDQKSVRRIPFMDGERW